MVQNSYNKHCSVTELTLYHIYKYTHTHTHTHTHIYTYGLFPGGSGGTESACNAGDLGSIPGLGRLSGEGNGTPMGFPRQENWNGLLHRGIFLTQESNLSLLHWKTDYIHTYIYIYIYIYIIYYINFLVICKYSANLSVIFYRSCMQLLR